MNKTLLPKLRFPEFQGSPEWENKNLGDVAVFLKGKGLPKSAITPDGKNECVHYGELFTEYSDVIETIKSHTNLISNEHFLSIENDVLMPTSDVTPSGLAKASCIKLNGVILGGDILVIRTDKSMISGEFLSRQIRYLENKVLQLVSGSTVFHLYASSIEKLSLSLPSFSEQQKIADCLTALDDLIAAQSQKVEALQAYKKGLMQNIFPAEGESVPRLRFPEFESAGEWEVNKFSEYIVLYRGSSPRPIQEYLTKSDDGVNWIKIGDTKTADNYIINQVEEKITPKGAEKSRKVSSGELILANSMSFGKTYQLAIDGYIYDGWFVLREYEEHFHKPFLIQLLNSEYMQNQYIRLSAGGIVLNISSDIVYSTILPHTSLEEQQRIAELLSAIDEEISAQNEVAAALKVHKKGLMQGLFPSMDEVQE